MNPQPSRLELESASDRTLQASGVIDSHTAGELEASLNDLGTSGDIHLDLESIDFIDSSGLRIIVSSHQELEASGNKLVLHGISTAVDRLFEITGLREHLHIAT